jgi:hypothetical protein
MAREYKNLDSVRKMETEAGNQQPATPVDLSSGINGLASSRDIARLSRALRWASRLALRTCRLIDDGTAALRIPTIGTGSFE